MFVILQSIPIAVLLRVEIGVCEGEEKEEDDEDREDQSESHAVLW